MYKTIFEAVLNYWVVLLGCSGKTEWVPDGYNELWCEKQERQEREDTKCLKCKLKRKE